MFVINSLFCKLSTHLARTDKSRHQVGYSWEVSFKIKQMVQTVFQNASTTFFRKSHFFCIDIEILVILSIHHCTVKSFVHVLPKLCIIFEDYFEFGNDISKLKLNNSSDYDFTISCFFCFQFFKQVCCFCVGF